MGKPYQKELDQLPETYRWAATLPTKDLASAVRSLSSFPLLAIGSGGSFTTADFVASLHREATGRLAATLTPMEVVSTQVDLRPNAVLLATAGGKNPDILGAFKRIAEREPRRLLVFCTSTQTPLARMASKFEFVDFIELSLPFGKDGFLATSSLLASTLLLIRLYSQVTDLSMSLPSDFQALLSSNPSHEGTEDFHARCLPLWSRETLIVLHGASTRSAAIDLESKFTEAALGNVQIADYRNFAHGRHHWLAKHPDQSGILAFVTPDEQETAARTLDLIPKKIPVLRIDIPFRGAVANLAGLANVLQIVGSAGRTRGIDPGRPGVPGFGRRIYHLRANEYVKPSEPELPALEAVAIERKSGMAIHKMKADGQLQGWRQAYGDFIRHLQDTPFRGIVFDYDGTLCDERHRRDGLRPEIARALTSLLRAGTMIGIATGRGKSVREALQVCIPKKHWDAIVVGYYNGADIALLRDDCHPDKTPEACESLRPVAEAIKGHTLLSQLAEFEFRLPQIKVESRKLNTAEIVWELLQQVVHAVDIPGVSVLRSSHSMDVVAPGVSKRAVIARLAKMVDQDDSAILCIGDRGQWPGNDFDLLSGPCSLSVDEVSRDPGVCWNLALPGHRGPQAVLECLRALRSTRSGLRFSLGPATKGKT